MNDYTAWPGMKGNPPLFVLGNYFNYTILAGWEIIRFHAFPVFDKSMRTIFEGNMAAISGGAIYSDFENTNIFMMPEVMFIKNTVTSQLGLGGSLFLNLNSLIYIYSSFQMNQANSGGAVAVSQLNFTISFIGCIFTENYASNGGGVFLGDGNGNGLVSYLQQSELLDATAIQFLKVRFIKNSAKNGGAVYISRVNDVAFQSTIFTRNNAEFVDGEGVGMDWGDPYLLTRKIVFKAILQDLPIILQVDLEVLSILLSGIK